MKTTTSTASTGQIIRLPELVGEGSERFQYKRRFEPSDWHGPNECWMGEVLVAQEAALVGGLTREYFLKAQLTALRFSEKTESEGSAVPAYPGEWVALQNDHVIAHSAKLVEVVREAREKGIPTPCVVFVEPGAAEVVKFGL